MLKVVHVRWKDPCFAQSGWMNQADFTRWVADDLPPSDSVGVLAYENEVFIVLLQSVGDNQVADGIKISRSAIDAITEIGEVPISLSN